jgi:hypothetical protein
MSGADTQSGQDGSQPRSMRIYVIVAVALVAVIVILAAILIARGRGNKEAATPTIAPTATLAATFTPPPTEAPTNTPPPPSTPSPVMADTDTPIYEFVSAGARPSAEWTGFFGQVTDAQGNPVPGVPLIVWSTGGLAASPVVKTDADGNYEIRLADEPLAGVWSIQVLTDDLQAASKLQTFRTDENAESGIQNIQVLWQKVR